MLQKMNISHKKPAINSNFKLQCSESLNNVDKSGVTLPLVQTFAHILHYIELLWLKDLAACRDYLHPVKER